MTAPQVKDGSSRARFPALDPEPAHRPVPWRLIASAAAVALVALGAVELSSALANQSHPHAAAAGRSGASAGAPGGPRIGPPPITARGQILAETPAGGLVLVSVSGRRHVTRLHGVGTFPPTPPIASPDNRYLFDTNGRVITIAKPGHPAVVRSPLVFSGLNLPAVLSSFADHDRYLVLRASEFGQASLSMPVDLGSISTGATIHLGAGDEAVGDPQAAGAFLSVARPLGSGGDSSQLFPDSRVELRDAGAKPVVLATSGQLDRAVGEPARLKVALQPFPSPDGSKVAVEVTPLARNTLSGIVVLSRAGRVLASVPLMLGAESGVFWNRSGSDFAYITSSSFGQSLTVTTLGGGTQTQEIPVMSRPVYYRTCVWSPDGADIACSDGKGAHWALAEGSGSQMELIIGPGLPIAWLP